MSCRCHTPLFLRHTKLNEVSEDQLQCAIGKRYKLEAAVLFAFVSSSIFFCVAFVCVVRYYRKVVRFLAPSEVPYKTIYRNSEDDVTNIRIPGATTASSQV